jgi:hypothetical protein
MLVFEASLFLAAYAAFCAVFIALLGPLPEPSDRK